MLTAGGSPGGRAEATCSPSPGAQAAALHQQQLAAFCGVFPSCKGKEGTQLLLQHRASPPRDI